MNFTNWKKKIIFPVLNFLKKFSCFVSFFWHHLIFVFGKTGFTIFAHQIHIIYQFLISTFRYHSINLLYVLSEPLKCFMCLKCIVVIRCWTQKKITSRSACYCIGCTCLGSTLLFKSHFLSIQIYLVKQKRNIFLPIIITQFLIKFLKHRCTSSFWNGVKLSNIWSYRTLLTTFVRMWTRGEFKFISWVKTYLVQKKKKSLLVLRLL